MGRLSEPLCLNCYVNVYRILMSLDRVMMSVYLVLIG